MSRSVVFGLLTFVVLGHAIYLNPYSYGSYDPAAENPYVYQYYARYYNPNPHNPYAPYPTYMKPGYFTLPRMYQIDPLYARSYPPNYAETLPVGQSVYHQPSASHYQSQPSFSASTDYESTSVGGGGCGQHSQSSYGGGCGGGSTSSSTVSGDDDTVASDFERLPIDRVQGSDGSAHDGSTFSSDRRRRQFTRRFWQ